MCKTGHQRCWHLLTVPHPSSIIQQGHKTRSYYITFDQIFDVKVMSSALISCKPLISPMTIKKLKIPLSLKCIYCTIKLYIAPHAVLFVDASCLLTSTIVEGWNCRCMPQIKMLIKKFLTDLWSIMIIFSLGSLTAFLITCLRGNYIFIFFIFASAIHC